jgi:hypothetical protein
MAKNRRINKEKLTTQLDSITANIVKKGIYVVNRKGDQYLIENYLTHAVVLSDIPVRKLADKLCIIYNAGKTLPIHRKIHLRNLSELFYKLSTQISLYQTVLKQNLHTEQQFTLHAKQSEAQARIAAVARQLETV